MRVPERLAACRFVVVTGKGGVGKSVVSTLIGRWLAARGRRVLLLEVDPRENLHELAGVSPSGGDVVEIAPRLLLQHLQPAQVIEQVVREHLRIPALVRRVVASPVFSHFVDAAPGLKPLAVLGHAFRVLHGHDRGPARNVDVVVLDAPATGHGVSLLHAPLVVSDVISEGPFGHMAADLARFVRDPEGTSVVVVTQAEEMPVQEALELHEAMRARLARSPDLLVVNGLYPRWSGAASGTNVLSRLWQTRRGLNERELERLSRLWSGPGVQLPLLPVERGPALVGALSALFDAGLRSAEAPS
jgi:anion-transporting  ArsA/GET3 family ATPase